MLFFPHEPFTFRASGGWSKRHGCGKRFFVVMMKIHGSCCMLACDGPLADTSRLNSSRCGESFDVLCVVVGSCRRPGTGARHMWPGRH